MRKDKNAHAIYCDFAPIRVMPIQKRIDLSLISFLIFFFIFESLFYFFANGVERDEQMVALFSIRMDKITKLKKRRAKSQLQD